jgi:hypothetical protein
MKSSASGQLAGKATAGPGNLKIQKYKDHINRGEKEKPVLIEVGNTQREESRIGLHYIV